MNDADGAPRRWLTPLALCIAGPIAGVLLGAATNAINDSVCSDYFAIVMSWDGTHPILQAVVQGMLEGFALGLFFAFFFTIASAASTRLRCPLSLAMRTLAMAVAIVLVCWIVGGVAGVILSLIRPQLWGFFFVGVPSRVSLPRFAWVGGSIWGAYGGTILALIVCGIHVHLRWRRISGPTRAFAVLMTDASVQSPS